MSDIFLKIFNMSISSCWIVLAIIVLRTVLKKAPKWINCVLWGIAGLRLVMPFSFESIFSLIPSAEFVPPEMIHSHSSVEVSGAEILNYVGNNPVWYDLGIKDGSLVFTEITASDSNFVNPLLVISYIASIVWIVGAVVLLIYTLVSFLKLKSKIGTAVLLRDNIYQSEAVASPFVLGIIKPKIYLPFNMNELDMEHVISHEQAHLSRKDHLWKPLGFLILTLHWFNPLIWLGYILLCRDIELACDEKVVKELNREQRADYSQALLTCSVNRRMIAACPIAFGEVGVKQRIKSVLNYKKPAFWMLVIAVIVSVVVLVCFMTDPKENNADNLNSGNNDEQTEIDMSEYTDSNTLIKDKIPNTADWKTTGLSSAGLEGVEFGEEQSFSFGKVYMLHNNYPSENYRQSFLAVETEKYIFLKDIEESYGIEISLCDVDATAGEEIILNQLAGAAGGAGAYNSYVYRLTENGLESIFSSFAFENKNGFDSQLQSPFTVRITNSNTGYELLIDCEGISKYVGTVFDEEGNPIDGSGYSEVMFDSFFKFAPIDTNADGVYEIECMQYAFLYSHADNIGDARSIIKYNEKTDEFDVVVAEFVPNWAKDVSEAYWSFNPYAGASFWYVTEYILPDGYEIKSAETSSGTATVDNRFYNDPDGGKLVKWSPDFYAVAETPTETDIVIKAVKDGKTVEFKLKITKVYDENADSDLVLKTYKVVPVNCKMSVKSEATYYLEEK